MIIKIKFLSQLSPSLAGSDAGSILIKSDLYILQLNFNQDNQKILQESKNFPPKQ